MVHKFPQFQTGPGLLLAHLPSHETRDAQSICAHALDLFALADAPRDTVNNCVRQFLLRLGERCEFKVADELIAQPDILLARLGRIGMETAQQFIESGSR